MTKLQKASFITDLFNKFKDIEYSYFTSTESSQLEDAFEEMVDAYLEKEDE